MSKRKWEATLDKCSNLCKLLKTTSAELLNAKHNGSLGEATQKSFNAKVIATLFDLQAATIRIEEEVEAQADGLIEYRKKLEEVNSRHDLAVYEKQLHQRELDECNTLKTISAESLGLLPLESYLALNKQATTKQNNEHQLLVERLNFELIHRKKLSQKVDELKDKRKKALDAKASSTKRLIATESKFKNLPKPETFNPLQLEKFPKAPTISAYLSSPLYLLYNQVCAYQEFFENSVSADIKGNSQDAMGYDSRHTGALRGNTATQKDLCAPHPLQVLVHLYPSSSNSQQSRVSMLTIEFSYYPLLKLVTARALRGDRVADEVLMTLFPGDEGDNIPMGTSYLLADGEESNINTFTQLMGRPYTWAQCVCGLSRLDTGFNLADLKKAQTPQDLAGQSIQSVFKQIREKIGN